MIHVLDNRGFLQSSVDLASLPGAIRQTRVQLPDDTLEPDKAWRFDGQAWVQEDPRVMSQRMTHLYFLSRFTLQERLAIRGGAATDPTLDDAMFMFNQAKNIDVELPLTQRLVGYLAIQGYITPERIPLLLARAPLGEDGVIE